MTATSSPAILLGEDGYLTTEHPRLLPQLRGDGLGGVLNGCLLLHGGSAVPDLLLRPETNRTDQRSPLHKWPVMGSLE